MKILITGSQGFVGRHFVKRLLQDGHSLTCIDVANGGIDARDFFRSDDTYFDKVIHLAAIVGGRKMIEGSPLALAVDLSIDAEMFGWALRTRPGCITYFSSSAAYPTYMQMDSYQITGGSYRLKESDINLSDISNPDLSYGWAKLTGEMLAQHARDKGLTVHVYRPFSGYGSDQSLDYPFPSFIQRAAMSMDPFTIWGDGNQVRDFIHIDDVVEASLVGCDMNITVSNLCTGRATSFNQLARIVVERTAYSNYTPKIEHLEAEPVGVDYRVGDPTHMNTFYVPKISLEDGIDLALAYR